MPNSDALPGSLEIEAIVTTIYRAVNAPLPNAFLDSPAVPACASSQQQRPFGPWAR